MNIEHWPNFEPIYGKYPYALDDETLERDLPDWLRQSIQDLLDGWDQLGPSESFPTWPYVHLESDIKISKMEREITPRQAKYLREKYLGYEPWEYDMPEPFVAALTDLQAAWANKDAGKDAPEWEEAYATVLSMIEDMERRHEIGLEESWYLRERYLRTDRQVPDNLVRSVWIK